jgi:hypothetical protein
VIGDVRFVVDCQLDEAFFFFVKRLERKIRNSTVCKHTCR